MRKYFITSDIHSYFFEFKKALDQSGFEIDNKDHILILCGDIFDRGFESIELYKFIKKIPKERRILIQGNHELLYLDLLEKYVPSDYDYSNGTVRTFCNIAGINEEELRPFYYYSQKIDSKDILTMIANRWQDVKNKVKKSNITKFIKSDEWINFYELDNFIFVHSFIPLRLKKCSETKWMHNWPLWRVSVKYLEPLPYWRSKARDYQWSDAKWGCPWQQFQQGLFNKEIKKDKILVCGHWHASAFHQVFEERGDPQNNNNIYFGKNIIALDGCTARSGQVNILVYDSETKECFDQYNNRLEVKE